MKKIIAITLMVIMTAASCFCMSGCGVDDIDISKYKDETITLKGISDEDVVVTIADLKAMDCKTIKASCTSDKVGEVKATGPELGVLLEAYGVSKEDFKKVTFKGTDQYDVPLMKKYITEHDIYLAIGIDGEPLDAECVPCRVVIPDSNSAYWIRMVNEIEFEK